MEDLCGNLARLFCLSRHPPEGGRDGLGSEIVASPSYVRCTLRKPRKSGHGNINALVEDGRGGLGPEAITPFPIPPGPVARK